jgi:gluconolactonase
MPHPSVSRSVDRRSFLRSLGSVATGTALTARGAFGQTSAQSAQIPPEVRRDWTSETVRYPDPDVIALDARFRRYIIGNTPIRRLHTGTLWAEGPAWNGVGRYLVWSDIPNNVQLRFIEDDGRVTVFRNPSGNSNGNTFDQQGRQISCEHGGRRVVRYEYSGQVTVIADKHQGKRLNSPNDAVVHTDGSIWFTDPPYGIRGNYEGFQAESETKPGVYRVDARSGQMTMITDEMTGPNGLCFSPDFKKLYVADTGTGREVRVFDVDGSSARNAKRHVQLNDPTSNAAAAADGIRCDVDGNLWVGARPGVQIIAPDGVPIGIIRLPENCANVCFGGSKRNRLFMTASQSLYSVYVGTQGAGFA